MKSDVVIPGIGIGGMTEKYDIKILICYLLDAVQTPLSRDQLNAVFQDGQVVNYFAFCDTLTELLKSGHLRQELRDGREVLLLNPLGVETARRLDRSLPKSLRDNVLTSALQLIARLRIERDNDVSIRPVHNGYMVDCRTHDGDFDIMRLSLYAPDRAQADTIRLRFLHDPSYIYQRLIELLLEQPEAGS